MTMHCSRSACLPPLLLLTLVLVVLASVAHVCSARPLPHHHTQTQGQPTCTKTPCNIFLTLSHTHAFAINVEIELNADHTPLYEWRFAVQQNKHDPLQHGQPTSRLQACWPPNLSAQDTLSVSVRDQDTGETKLLASVAGPSVNKNCLTQRVFDAPAGWLYVMQQQAAGNHTPPRQQNVVMFMAEGNMCAENGPVCLNGATCSNMFPAFDDDCMHFYECACAPGWIGMQCNRRPNFCSYTAPDGSFYEFSDHTPEVMRDYCSIGLKDSNTTDIVPTFVDLAMCDTFNPFSFPIAACNSSYSLCRYHKDGVGIPLGTWWGPGGAQWQLIDANDSSSGVRITFDNGPPFSPDGGNNTQVILDFPCERQAADTDNKPVAPPRAQYQAPLIYPSTITFDEDNNMVNIVVNKNTAKDVPYNFFCPLGKNPCLSSPCQHGGSCFTAVQAAGTGEAATGTAVLTPYCICPAGYSGENCEHKQRPKHV